MLLEKSLVLPAKRSTSKILEPDPIMRLHRVIGFGGAHACFTADGKYVVYPVHAVVVVISIDTGQQTFFTGHTNSISTICLNPSSSLLASGQEGKQSLVRIWKFKTGTCVTVAKAHDHGLALLQFSACGRMLCGIGKDGRGQHLIVLWNTTYAEKGTLDILAKAHTDFDISAMSMDPVDTSRLVTCGTGNLQLWRIRDGTLRCCSMNLRQCPGIILTDVCYQHDYKTTGGVSVWASSSSGYVFEVNPDMATIKSSRLLLPEGAKETDIRMFSKKTIGEPINSIAASETKWATGSQAGLLQVWLPDFSSILLEAEHDCSVRNVSFSSDGTKVLIVTDDNSLAFIDVNTQAYTTLMRSHTDEVLAVSMDADEKYLGTVSADGTVRVWSQETSQQLYDFRVSGETPCNLSFSPSKLEFACGFISGRVIVFSINVAGAVTDLRKLRGCITGLVYSNGSQDPLCYCDQFGSLTLYHTTGNDCRLIRCLPNVVLRNVNLAPNAIVVSQDGGFIACVGPSEYIVTVMDTVSLDEVLRIDVCSAVLPSGAPYPMLDAALQVSFIGRLDELGLLVATSSGRLLKFDANNGKIVSQVRDFHTGSCSALTATQNGKLILSAGNTNLKVPLHYISSYSLPAQSVPCL